MLKYEIKKYILKPSIIISLSVFLLINLVKVLEIYYYTGGGRNVLFGGKDRTVIGEEILYEKYRGEITDEKIEMLKAELKTAEAKLKEYGIIEEPIEDSYTGYPYGDVYVTKDIIKAYEYAILYSDYSNSLSEKAFSNAEFFKGINDYDYRKNLLLADCYKSRAVDSFCRTRAYSALFDYKFSTILSMLIIILAISPIVAKEKSIGYDRLIVSTGKGTRVMIAKIITASFFTVISSFILFASDVIYYQQIYGFDGLNLPIYAIEAFKNCPFELTFIGAVFMTYLLRLTFLLTFSFMVVFISALSKNEIASMAVSMGTAFLLVILSEHIPSEISPTSLIGTSDMFSRVKLTDVLGFPVFSFVVALFVVALLSVIFIAFAIRRGRKCC